MLGNNKMDLDQLDKCVRGCRFLSPRLYATSMSNNTQRTESEFCTGLQNHSENQNVQRSRNDRTAGFSSPFLHQVFSHWTASCEETADTPSATAKMEEASKKLQQRVMEGHSTIVSEMEVQEYLAKETGKDRLQKMFAKDHVNQLSPEMQFIKQITLQSAGVTFLTMSVLAGRQAKNEFIERNRITVFKTRFQAFRRLNDAVFLFSMKEGAKWALRVSLFTASFLGIAQSISAYRNKSTPLEYCFASAVTVGALKANLGLRAFIVGSGFGGILGLFMGLMAVGGMKATNETQEQRHYWQIMKELEKEKIFKSKLTIKMPEPNEAEAVPQTA